MKNWKKLFFTVLVSSTAGVLADCCNNNATGTTCGATCGDCCDVNTNACCAGGHIINKSVYVDVGFGQIGTYLHDNFFRNNLMDNPEDGWGSAFRAEVFGGKTTDGGSDGLGRRFGLNGKRCMVVAEGSDAATHNATIFRDIDPTNFNLRTVNSTLQDESQFLSTICFCPKQSTVGALLSWKQSLCSTDEGKSRWWFELNLPIVHVEHNMNLREIVAQDGGGAIQANGLNGAPIVGNMIAAFNQPSWNYGKIAGCMSHTELANLEFVIGYNPLTGDCCRVSSYLGFAAPTTKRRCGTYVFEPIVGQEHWAIVWGSQWDIKMCEWECSHLVAHLAIDSHWWFNRSEIRSFDLIGKPWSRYQEMYANFAAATAANAAQIDNPSDRVYAGTAGINLMTRCVEVTPGFQINGNMALAYKGCRFMAEIGHTFYAREAEKICPNWSYGPAIKDVNGAGGTNTARTIGYQYPLSATEYDTEDTYNLTAINVCDIDWNSGAHEAVLAHSIYGTLGYAWEDWCYPTFISAGASYDFTTEDKGTSVMRRWNAFGQIGLSF